MAMWGAQICQSFEATAVGFDTGFSRLRVRHSIRYAIAPNRLIRSFAKSINAGVSHGSILGHLLFIIFIDDMSDKYRAMSFYITVR